MPSSGSRPEGDLTTDFKSPEMTWKARASTSCDGACGHLWLWIWSRWLSRAPGHTAWSCHLCWVMVLRYRCFDWLQSMRCALCFGGNTVVLCFLYPARIYLFCICFGVGFLFVHCFVLFFFFIKRVDNCESIIPTWETDTDSCIAGTWILNICLGKCRSCWC